MKDILGKINKAIDVITDAMVDQLSSINEVNEYKYADLQVYIKKMRSEYPEISRFRIAIDRSSECSGKVYASERFIIRIVMLDVSNAPILADKKNDDYIGTIVVAEAIDMRLMSRMAGEKVKTFICSGGR